MVKKMISEWEEAFQNGWVELQPLPKGIKFCVNGRVMELNEGTTLTHETIVRLAGFEGRHVTVQYTRGEFPKPSGVLVAGQSVKLTEGMVIDAVPTNAS
jgi:hypothetical protein